MVSGSMTSHLFLMKQRKSPRHRHPVHRPSRIKRGHDRGPGITWQVPFTQPQCPAPQSRGPLHSRVHTVAVQFSLYAALMQPVGWQHPAATQSESFEQLVRFRGGQHPGLVTHPAMRMAETSRRMSNTIHRCFSIMAVNTRLSGINLITP